MIDLLTSNPLARFLQKSFEAVAAYAQRALTQGAKGGLTLKLSMAVILGGLSLVFYRSILEYRNALEQFQISGVGERLKDLPSVIPIICEGFGVFLILVAFLVSLWVNETSTRQRRRAIIVIVLSLAALASIAVWMPSDILETQAAISGKALAGESPSIPAYFGKLLLISLIILSVPLAALIYFRLGLLDRYLVNNFVSPFALTLLTFMGIFIIGDLTENGSDLGYLSPEDGIAFFVVQMPFVVLFVMPVAVLLSGLSALTKMSKANELISMIGAGRSVLRILAPLLVMGAYTSLVGLAFKYEWAPTSVGYRKAIIERAVRLANAEKDGKELKPDIWGKEGWMHVNDVDRRTWFVGKVPLKLSDEMADVVVIQLDEQDQPKHMWVASRGGWVWDSEPPKWVLTNVRVYTYDKDHIPLIEKKETLEITSWSETPWKVLSSSQNPSFLGIPGLTMYLNANRDRDPQTLAVFRTNWWYTFAEPVACMVLMLVAAPLGIVYSRHGGMGGVTGAIIIFALMFVMRGTFLAMGHSNRMPPILAAWMTNIIIGSIGLFLLWLRAGNREVISLKTLMGYLRRRG